MVCKTNSLGEWLKKMLFKPCFFFDKWSMLNNFQFFQFLPYLFLKGQKSGRDYELLLPPLSTIFAGNF